MKKFLNIKIFTLFLNLLVFSWVFVTLNTFCSLENTWHFQTDILANPSDVKQRLINPKNPEERFQEVDIDTAIELEIPAQNGQTIKQIFSKEAIIHMQEQMPELKSVTSQSKKIKGLFLERPNARATIIFTPGFWPGYKEVFAPFVKIAPPNCNLLFIELQGHGESQGPSCCENVSSCLKLPGLSSLPCSLLPSCLLPGCLKSNSCCSQNLACKTIKFFFGLKKYGLHEHKDIIGAAYWVAERTQRKPIILFGWCAGAHINALTLIRLREIAAQQKNLNQNLGHNEKTPDLPDLIAQLNIQGLIFDSGFGSINDAARGIYKYKDRKIAKCLEPIAEKPLVNSLLDKTSTILSWGAKLLSKIPGLSKLNVGKEMIKAGLLYTPKIITDCCLKIIECIFKKSIRKNAPKTNLFNRIDYISDMKVFFVHSQEDSLAPFARAQELASHITNHEFWATTGDYHAKNQLKYKDEYKEKLEQWLNNTIVPQTTDSDTQNRQENQSNGRNIQRMIQILDELSEILDKPINSSTKQIFIRRLEEFETLLHNPNTNIPQNIKQQIIQKLTSMPQSKTPQGTKKILQEIKEILESLLENQKIVKQKNNKPSLKQKLDTQTQDSKNTNPTKMPKIPDLYSKKIPTYNVSDKRKPTYILRKNNSKNLSKNIPTSGSSHSPSNYSPSNGGNSDSGYTEYSDYPGYNDNYPHQYPEYSQDNKNLRNSGNNNTDWDSPFSNHNSQGNNKKQISQGITYSDIMAMDPTYDEMPDLPDEPKSFHSLSLGNKFKEKYNQRKNN